MHTYGQTNPLQMSVRGEMLFNLTSKNNMISEFNKDVQEIHLEKNQEETEKNKEILWGNRNWEAYPFPQKAWLPYARLGKNLRHPEEKLKRSDQTDDKIRQQLAISDTLIGLVRERPEDIRNKGLRFVYKG